MTTDNLGGVDMSVRRRKKSRRVAAATIAAALAAGVSAAPASASDANAARRLVITKSDVGPGYSESKTDVTPDAFGTLATCVGIPVPDRKVATDLQGSAFGSQSSGAIVFSSVQIVATKSMARADRGVLANQKFPDCVAQQLAGSQGAANHLTGIQARRVTVKHFGDYSTAILVEGTGTIDGDIPIAITQIEVGIVKGRAELSAGFTTRGQQPFNRRVAEQILAKVTKRLDRTKL